MAYGFGYGKSLLLHLYFGNDRFVGDFVVCNNYPFCPIINSVLSHAL